MKFKGGSAQKSWAMCPGGSYAAPTTNAAGAYVPAGRAQPSPVSGYVNGYHPSLPPHPPTRAQMAEMERMAAAGGGAPPQVQQQGGGGSLASFSARYTDLVAAQGKGADDEGPAKPPPPPPMPAPFDPEREPRDVLLRGGARVPRVGAAAGVPVGAPGGVPVHASLGAGAGAKADGAATFVSVAVGAGGDARAAVDAAGGKVDLVELECDGLAQDKLLAAWSGLEPLVAEGKAACLGLRGADEAAVAAVCASAATKPATNAVETSACDAKRRLVGLCRRQGVQVVALKPLGAAEDRARPEVEAAAKRAGKSAAAVLARHALERGVAAVAGTAEELEALKEAMRFELAPEDRAALSRMG